MAYTPEQKDETRQRVVDAAVAQIADTGLASLSARTIAKSVGFSAPSLYNYFADFDEIVIAANSRTLALLDERLTATATANADEGVADRFFALALAYMQFTQDEPRRWLALFEHQLPEGRELPPEHKLEHYILFRHIEAPLSEVMPGESVEELRMISRTIYSAVHGVVSLGLQGRLDPVPVPILTEQLRMLTTAFATGYAQIDL
jgi:AcrR family transcriptional regulator